jgi:hypothetical protein
MSLRLGLAKYNSFTTSSLSKPFASSPGQWLIVTVRPIKHKAHSSVLQKFKTELKTEDPKLLHY